MHIYSHYYNITRSRRRQPTTTMCINDTLGTTSFNWTSNYMLIKVFSVLSKLPPRVLEDRGGGTGFLFIS